MTQPDADPSFDPDSGDENLALIRRAQTGDFNAFEELVHRFQGRVYGIAFRILGQAQDAEDVVQQTFLSLIENIESFRAESSVSTWILRIGTNFALKVLRKKRGLPTMAFDEKEESFATIPHPGMIAQWRDTPHALLERAEVRELLAKAIAELDDKYRVVFVLRDIEGMTTEETAESLGLTTANVKVRLMRARMQLRERLTRELGDESTRMIPDHGH